MCVCVWVCVWVRNLKGNGLSYQHQTRYWYSNTKWQLLGMHWPRGQMVKGQGHMVTKTVTVTRLAASGCCATAAGVGLHIVWLLRFLVCKVTISNIETIQNRTCYWVIIKEVECCKCSYTVSQIWRCQVRLTQQDMKPLPCDQSVLLLAWHSHNLITITVTREYIIYHHMHACTHRCWFKGKGTLTVLRTEWAHNIFLFKSRQPADDVIS